MRYARGEDMGGGGVCSRGKPHRARLLTDQHSLSQSLEKRLLQHLFSVLVKSPSESQLPQGLSSTGSDQLLHFTDEKPETSRSMDKKLVQVAQRLADLI